MTTHTLSPEALHDALKAILERGEYPSMAKVRTELATTVSQQTLSQHMKRAWQDLADQMGTGLPEGLPQTVVDAAHRFYAEAHAFARAELDRQRETMEQREAALNRHAEKLRQRAATLEDQLGHVQQRAEQAETALQRTTQERDRGQQALEDTADKLAANEAETEALRLRTAQQLRRLRSDHRYRLADLAHERDHFKAAWQQEIDRGESQQRMWAQQIDRARQTAQAAEQQAKAREKALRDELTRAQETTRQHAQALHDKDVQLHELSISAETLKAKLTEAERQVSEGERFAASASEDRDAALADNAKLRQENTALRDQTSRLTAIADERKNLLDALRHELPKAGFTEKTSSKPKPQG